ncbi:MAG TPA: MYG1 family protein [Spirochaetota bacterium]|nr:MYG1 family protein [Spirochaetota bacterium]
MNINNVNTIAVHDGTFHADDVFAAAITIMLNPSIKVIRTRDTQLLTSVDLRIDVGGKHCVATGDFDHHMTGGAGKRAGGIPYAACGLIWKHYGRDLAKSDHVFEHIDRRIIQTIDAIDCGHSVGEENLPYIHYNISDAIDGFNPAWNDEPPNHDAAFMRAVTFAVTILQNEIRLSRAFENGKSYVYDAISKSRDHRFIVLEKYCPWQDIVVRETDALYVLFPSATGDWRVRAVPERIGSYTVRKPLPKIWGGKTPEELAAITGIPDASFCHQSLFIAGASSREGAEKMLELALK